MDLLLFKALLQFVGWHRRAEGSGLELKTHFPEAEAGTQSWERLRSSGPQGMRGTRRARAQRSGARSAVSGAAAARSVPSADFGSGSLGPVRRTREGGGRPEEGT